MRSLWSRRYRYRKSRDHGWQGFIRVISSVVLSVISGTVEYMGPHAVFSRSRKRNSPSGKVRRRTCFHRSIKKRRSGKLYVSPVSKRCKSCVIPYHLIICHEKNGVVPVQKRSGRSLRGHGWPRPIIALTPFRKSAREERRRRKSQSPALSRFNSRTENELRTFHRLKK